jgi:hypothetical protein
LAQPKLIAAFVPSQQVLASDSKGAALYRFKSVPLQAEFAVCRLKQLIDRRYLYLSVAWPTRSFHLDRE